MAEVAGKGGAVAEERNLPYHVIQTHIILNDWPGKGEESTSVPDPLNQ
jgi:hypothetical protein